MFTILCLVEADLSSCGGIIRCQKSDRSGVYYTTNFDVVLLFGLTKFKAQIAWDEDVSRSIYPSGCLAHVGYFSQLQGEEKR